MDESIKNKLFEILGCRVSDDFILKNSIEYFDDNYWATINGYQNYYLSIDGKVLNKKTNKYVSVGEYRKGHHSVRLWNNNKSKLVNLYRILAIHFIPNPESKKEVNHKDGNRMNYNIRNLEWTTPSENMKHAFENKLTNGTFQKGLNHSLCKLDENRLSYIFELRRSGKKLKDIAKLVDMNYQHISRILNGKIYKNNVTNKPK